MLVRRLVFVGVIFLGQLATLALAAGPQSKSRMDPIPAGDFQRSDGKMIHVESFSLLGTEVTWSQFKKVCDWGQQHGYQFDGGIGQADLPAQNITWYDATKWCNALSEMIGRRPAYFMDAARSVIYRAGKEDLTNDCVDWQANGYRLPTEAEWEYAYRAGTTTRFYWGDYPRITPINHRYAVFHEWGTDEIDGGPVPVGTKVPNAFGLYDMAGNVEEWVWDRYTVNYEGVAADSPKGATSGSLRLVRGGGFVIDRLFGAPDRHPTYPDFVNCDIGFRIASSDTHATAELFDDLAVLPLQSDDIKPFSDPHPVLEVREDTDEAAARRLFPMLDLSMATMKEAAAAYKAQRYAVALSALRDLYVARLKTLSVEPWNADSVNTTAVDRWMAVYNQKRPIVWFGPKADSSTMVFGATVNLSGSPDLAHAFVKSGKPEYRDAYFWMLSDASLRAKPAWNVLTKSERGSLGIPRDNFMAFIGFNAGHPLAALYEISWMLRHLPQGQTCDVPPRVLANALYSAVVDRLAAGLQDDRGNVPNQVWGNALNVFACSRVLAEFKDAALWRSEAIRRLLNSAGTVMADGSDLEASINYNTYQIPFVEDDLDNAFKREPVVPDWLKELDKRIRYRRYMYAALATPLGSYPSIGNQSDEKDRPRKELKKWLDEGKFAGLESIVNATLGKKEPAAPIPPAFDSVALPYGGYYALRTGWQPDDLYCFMRSSRDGVGHGRTDNNNLQVIAYGAYLLIHGGDADYDHPAFLPEYERPLVPYFTEPRVGNVFNSNNLSVDGLEQGRPQPRLILPTGGWDRPRELPFYTAPAFDLMEGRFTGTYESEPPVSDKVIHDLVADYGMNAMAKIAEYNARVKQTPYRTLEATHTRDVFLLKPEKFWIVVDSVNGGSQYTNVWHFPPPSEGLDEKSFICPGFDPNQVRVDDAQKRVVTISHYRPNLAILNFCSSNVSYTKHFGDMFPFKGWYSFGIVGDRVPAVTVEGTWAGKAPMVSVLYPSPSRPSTFKTLDDGLEGFAPLNTESVSGFSLKRDGQTIIFQSSCSATPLTAFGIKSTARSLLAKQQANGVIEGIVLGCTDISLDGQPQHITTSDFHFRVENGQLRTLAEIESPKVFDWKPNVQGQLAPSYK